MSLEMKEKRSTFSISDLVRAVTSGQMFTPPGLSCQSDPQPTCTVRYGGVLDCRLQPSCKTSPHTLQSPFSRILCGSLHPQHLGAVHFCLSLSLSLSRCLARCETKQQSIMPISSDSSSSDFERDGFEGDGFERDGFERDGSESNACFGGSRAAKVPAGERSPSHSLGGVFASYRRRKGTVFKTLRLGGKGDANPVPVSPPTIITLTPIGFAFDGRRACFRSERCTYALLLGPSLAELLPTLQEDCAVGLYYQRSCSWFRNAGETYTVLKLNWGLVEFFERTLFCALEALSKSKCSAGQSRRTCRFAIISARGRSCVAVGGSLLCLPRIFVVCPLLVFGLQTITGFPEVIPIRS